MASNRKRTVEAIEKTANHWKIHISGREGHIVLDPAIAKDAGIADGDAVDEIMVDNKTTIITISVPMRVRLVLLLTEGRITEVLDRNGKPYQVPPPPLWGTNYALT